MSNYVERLNCCNKSFFRLCLFIFQQLTTLLVSFGVMILYLHETRLIYFVILSVPRRWNVVNTKALILAIYRVTFQIVKWNVADIYFPKMSLIAALQIVSWIVRKHSWSLHKYHQFQIASAVQLGIFFYIYLMKENFRY